MNTYFTFVHGWGGTPGLWDDLSTNLPANDSHRIDLGFIGTQQNLLNGFPAPSIYVTHSLGTMWALKKRPANMKALIAINGFSCFQNFTSDRVLHAMQAQLQRNPEAQMQEFWKTCNLPSYAELNVARLQEGLEWLASWNAKPELEALTCPVLALAGDNDPILPIDKMKNEWAGFDLHIREGGDHALPLSHPQWCAKHIEEFLNEL